MMLHPRHLVPSGFDLLTEQAAFLVQAGQSPAMQWFLGWVYRLGVFFAFFGTIYGAFELYMRTMRECFVALFPRLRPVPIHKFRVATTLWCGVPGLLLLWLTNKDPVELLTPPIIVSSTVVCGVWCFAMLWADRVALPEELQMRLPLRLSLFA